MTQSPYNVLFLCTGNSARSIMAECLVERWGASKFKGFSAGSHPTGHVNPFATDLLNESGFETSHLRSKSWDEFAAQGAPVMDFVFTVCDDAAGETCPVWPGQPVTAHWGVPDPAAVLGSSFDRITAFRSAFRMLENRIKLFSSLPVAKLDRITLTQKTAEIGRLRPDAAEGLTS
jgi:arsenate reductase